MLNKADYPPKHRWASSSQLKSMKEKGYLPRKSKFCLQSPFRRKWPHQLLPGSVGSQPALQISDLPAPTHIISSFSMENPN